MRAKLQIKNFKFSWETFFILIICKCGSVNFLLGNEITLKINIKAIWVSELCRLKKLLRQELVMIMNKIKKRGYVHVYLCFL